MRRSASLPWRTAFWIGWYTMLMPSSCKENRCARIRIPNRRRRKHEATKGAPLGLGWAYATPKTRRPNGRRWATLRPSPSRPSKDKTTARKKKQRNFLDGCRSLLQDDKRQRRFAPILIGMTSERVIEMTSETMIDFVGIPTTKFRDSTLGYVRLRALIRSWGESRDTLDPYVLV